MGPDHRHPIGYTNILKNLKIHVLDNMTILIFLADVLQGNAIEEFL